MESGSVIALRENEPCRTKSTVCVHFRVIYLPFSQSDSVSAKLFGTLRRFCRKTPFSVDKREFLGYNVSDYMERVHNMNRFSFNKKFVVKATLACIFIIAGIIGGIVSTNVAAKKEAEIGKVVSRAETLAKGYFYDEALEALSSSEFAKEEKAVAAADKIKKAKSELVEYDGQFYHIFFHSLIVYPELAFDGDLMHEGYDMWMTTASEFKAMLPQLYERGFVLCSLKDIKAGEKMLFPKDKKPLIISIDDVNYYDYMENDGFADRLVVDEKGNIVCEVKTPEGKTELSYDGDVMPILDKFVEEHPDFSYRGAKGVVAVTGYEGVFGYDFIDEDEKEKEKLKAEATKVAKALKNTGWLIACHSYTHNEYFKDGSVSNQNLHYDTNRFKERIYETVFEPDIYISPFGYHLREGDERLQYLKNMGYDYFCPVSTAMRTSFTKEGVVIQERFNMDRFTMRTKKDYINETFFDVDSVYYK